MGIRTAGTKIVGAKTLGTMPGANTARVKSLRRISLNHAPAPASTRRGQAWLMVGLLAAAFTAYSASQQQSQLHALQAEKVQLLHPAQPQLRKLPAGEQARHQDEIKVVNTAMSELNQPWEALFQALETTKTPQVRIMTLDPNPRQHKLRMTVQASDYQHMLDYVSVLNRQPMLRDAFLMAHEQGGSAQSADGQALPYSFAIEAVWLN